MREMGGQCRWYTCINMFLFSNICVHVRRKTRNIGILRLANQGNDFNDDIEGQDEKVIPGKWSFLGSEDVQSMDIQQMKEALAERGLSVG